MRHLVYFLAIEADNGIAFLQAGFGCGRTFHHFIHPYTGQGSEVGSVALGFLAVDIVGDITAGYTQYSTLNGSIGLEVGYNLVHYGCRDGETIAAVTSGLGIEHGIDADKFALGIDAFILTKVINFFLVV